MFSLSHIYTDWNVTNAGKTNSYWSYKKCKSHIGRGLTGVKALVRITVQAVVPMAKYKNGKKL